MIENSRGKAPDMRPLTDVADAAIDNIDNALAQYYDATAPQPRSPHARTTLLGHNGGVLPSTHELGMAEDRPAPDMNTGRNGIHDLVQRLIGGKAFRGTFVRGRGRSDIFFGGIEENIYGDATEEE